MDVHRLLSRKERKKERKIASGNISEIIEGKSLVAVAQKTGVDH